MNPADLEQLAHQACFSTELTKKQNAQQLIMTFCSQLQASDYQTILQNSSQTVIFVVMEYTFRNLKNCANLKPFLISIYESIKVWYQPNGQFIRNNSVFKKYVINSVNRTLGQTFKIIFKDKDSKNWCLQFIQKEINDKFRLHLWKILIQAVSQVDSSQGFMSYRSLSYSFQEDAIPKIVQQLIPYFMNVVQIAKMNEISVKVRDNLSLVEGDAKNKINIFNPSEQLIANLVFTLLKEVMCFNYNITYSQYDMDSMYQNSSIHFPQSLAKKIVSKQFQQSMFYLIQKLSIQAPQQNYLSICLQAELKIMQCRMSYVDNDARKQFTVTVLNGLNRMLRMSNFSQSILQKILQKILEVNIKFIYNSDAEKLMLHQKQFGQWLQLSKQLTLKIILNTNLNYQNEILKQILQLQNLVIGLGISPKLQPFLEALKANGIQILRTFLCRFFQNQFNIMGQTKIRKIKQLKKISSLFFMPFKTMVGINFKANLQLLQFACDKILQSNSVYIISNFFLLITQITEQHFLERNIFYNIPTKEEIKPLSVILVKCLQFINNFRANKNSNQLLEIVFLLFIEKITTQCLKKLDYKDGTLKLGSSIFQFINSQLNTENQQGFLIQCFHEMTRAFGSNQIETVEYALDILAHLTLKFKWALRRDSFKATMLSKQLLSFCHQISLKGFKKQMIKYRKQLYKIISLLSFDDVMDSYRENIDNLFKILMAKIQSNPEQIIYDLTGVFQTIDSTNIYKYFLNKLETTIGINKMITQFFNLFGSDEKKVKSILKLMLAMVENKSQRLSNPKVLHNIYSLIKIFLPFWNKILMEMVNEKWNSIILQMHRIFKAISRGNHLNFYLIKKHNKQLFIEFLILEMRAIVQSSKWASHYPKIAEIIMQLGNVIGKDTLVVFLQEQYPALIENLSGIISYFIDLNIKSLQKLLDGNRKAEVALQRVLDINKSIFSTFRSNLRFIHLPQQINNINYLLNHHKQQKQQFLIAIFHFCLGNGKNYQSVNRSIYSLVQDLCVLYNTSYEKIVKQLGINEQKVKSLSLIWNSQLQGENQLFISSIQDWFKNCQPDYIIEFDY